MRLENSKFLTTVLFLAVLISSVFHFSIGTDGFSAGNPPATTDWLSTGSGGFSSVAEASPASYRDNLLLLSRLVQGEAGAEPFTGKVGVGAVILNRMRSASFPNTLSGVVFQPLAFESVARGIVWRYSPSRDSIRAAASALSGWDPTYGALYFWNPSKRVSPWVWTRRIITQIGRHIFAR